MKCEANISPTSTRCNRETSSHRRICDDCVRRVHETMLMTLYRYGRSDVACELDEHYKREHSPERWRLGFVCYECFCEGHNRTVTNIKNGLHYHRACFTV